MAKCPSESGVEVKKTGTSEIIFKMCGLGPCLTNVEPFSGADRDVERKVFRAFDMVNELFGKDII